MIKRLFLITILLLTSFSIVFAKTLVKYQKTTGDILQTNTIDEMPTPEILADRFKSADTDVILVNESVDISKQRVNVGKKTIVDIPKKELDDIKKVNDEIDAEHILIEKEKDNMAIQSLKNKGKSLKYFKE